MTTLQPTVPRHAPRGRPEHRLDGEAGSIATELSGSVPSAPPCAFDPDEVADRPEPARRWLTHAIPAGAPLARSIALRTHGEIRLGRHWHEYTATHLIVPATGFVWAARTRVAGLPVSGFDAYADDAGLMNWRPLGLPLPTRHTAELTRSAADRLAAESVLLPTALVTADWRHRYGPDSARYVRAFAGRHARAHVDIHVAGDGQLESLSMLRWGRPHGTTYGEHRFTVRFDGEQRAGGIAIPDGMHAAWVGPGGETNDFFRAHIDSITLDPEHRR